MDIDSSAATVVGLVFQFATAIKTCNDLRSRYKDAARTIESIRHELETLQGALQELANLMMNDADALASRWDSSKTLPMTFARAIRGFKRTIKGLLQDMEPLRRKDSGLGKMDKFQFLWNEDAMKEHLGQLRAQSSALQLLLLVFHTGTMSEVKSNIANVENAILQLSISTNNSEDRADLLDFESSENESDVAAEPRHSIHTEALREAFASTEFINAGVEDDTNEKGQPNSSFSIIQPLIKTSSSKISSIEDESSSVLDLEFPHDEAHKANGASLDDTYFSHPFEISQTLGGSATNGTLKVPKRSHVSDSHVHENGHIENGEILETLVQNLEAIHDHSGCSRPSTPTEVIDRSKVDVDEMEYDPSKSPPDLIRAVIRGDQQDVARLLDVGHDIECLHPGNGRTGAIIAASLGHAEVLGLLLKRHASVTATDRELRTALHYAASEGYIHCVELLLSYGAPTDSADRWREIPLHRAVRHERVGVFKILFERSTDPIRPQTSRGFTILHLAVNNDQVDIIRTICEATLQIEHHLDCPSESTAGSVSSPSCSCPRTYPGWDTEDATGRTPLQRGFLYPYENSVEALLQYSCRGEQVHWERPLHYAIRRGEETWDLLKVLLKFGVDIHLRDSAEQTPLEVAILYKNWPAARRLLREGAQLHDMSAQSPGVSLLGKAIEVLSPTALLDLLPPTMEQDRDTNFDLRFINAAQTLNRWDHIKAFWESGPFPRHRIGIAFGVAQTLQFAIKDANEEAIKFLLELGVEVNGRFTGPEGEVCSAIHIAASESSVSILKLLLEHSASILDENNGSNLPFHYAVRYSSLEMVTACFDSMVELSAQEVAYTQIGKVMNHGIRIACGRGSLEKVIIILDLAENGSIEVSRGLLHVAVANGRINIVKALLDRGYDPRGFVKRSSIMDAPFRPKSAMRGQLVNTIEDYEECKRLIREAIYKKETKPLDRNSKKKEKDLYTRRP
ncbi:hypothetical protein G7Y89_g12267 [Cudoniella acicularis]|uniref:Ankyrin repeat protein n=1 Tax=Cudoniella acicularis TaxID=354080 RepID=A0A8H4RBV5_9HELO|nr:hypothetical protein G7Y89_g12267 [Cudoniella acicularis]